MGIDIDADLVLLNANVITMDDCKERAEAIAIKEGRFLLVGKGCEVKKAIGRKTDVRDMRGRTVIPGFIESHNHTLQFGLTLSGVDLRMTRTIEEINRLIKAKADFQSDRAWIIGFGYNQNELAEKRHPTRWDLDKVSPNHPVILKHTSGHSMVANTEALKIAGISINTLDPEGGKIERDIRTGEPTGVLLAFPAIKLMKNVLPTPSFAEMVEALGQANNIMLSEGITSATDVGLGHVGGPREIGAYQEAMDRGLLQVRHTVEIWADAIIDFMRIKEELDSLEWKLLSLGIRTGLGNENFKIGALKFVLDGAISACTAAAYQPYGADLNNQNNGALLIPEEPFRKLVKKIHKFGWQLSIHAIGERANDMALDAIEYALQMSPRGNCRPRIEHAAMVTPAILEKMKRLNIIAVVQPGFIWELGDSWIKQLGSERASNVKPFRSFAENNIMMAFSSDRPVISGAPLIGIHAAVNQKTKSGCIYAPQEKISAEEALRCYTLHGAYATFEEDIKGSITPGKLADLVVLEEDVTRVPIDKIKDIRVMATMIDGIFLFER